MGLLTNMYSLNSLKQDGTGAIVMVDDLSGHLLAAEGCYAGWPFDASSTFSWLHRHILQRKPSFHDHLRFNNTIQLNSIMTTHPCITNTGEGLQSALTI